MLSGHVVHMGHGLVLNSKLQDVNVVLPKISTCLVVVCSFSYKGDPTTVIYHVDTPVRAVACIDTLEKNYNSLQGLKIKVYGGFQCGLLPQILLSRLNVNVIIAVSLLASTSDVSLKYLTLQAQKKFSKDVHVEYTPKGKKYFSLLVALSALYFLNCLMSSFGDYLLGDDSGLSSYFYFICKAVKLLVLVGSVFMLGPFPLAPQNIYDTFAKSREYTFFVGFSDGEWIVRSDNGRPLSMLAKLIGDDCYDHFLPKRERDIEFDDLGKEPKRFRDPTYNLIEAERLIRF